MLSPAEKTKLRKLVAAFQDTRLLVIGDVMLDQFIRGGVSRISPEAPVPVVSVSSESFIPGGAGNVANNLASLGARVENLALVGDDAAGRELSRQFAAKGISTARMLVDADRVTSQKCRVIAEHQQVVRYDRETLRPLSAAAEKALLKNIDDALRSAQGVILSDYGKGVVSPRVLAAAISGARRRGLPVTVDPKIENFPRYRRVSCITPNLQEAWAGMRRIPRPGEKALVSLGRDMLRQLEAETVLITRGAEGMSLFERSGRVTHIPTRAQEVFDVTGAGDTVISVLTLALACGAKPREAAELANHAAGIVVGKLGTAVTNQKELARSIR